MSEDKGRLTDGPAYEPTRIERVVTSADLDREVLYAGPATSDPV